MTRHDPFPLPPDPHTVPVLDCEAGIERLMGNRPLYLRVLARFRSDYHGSAGAIRDALEAHDTELAQRLAHTLKGAAGMIEAQALHATALALEDVLRGGKRDARTLLPPLEAALTEVLRELDAMEWVTLATPPPAPAPDNAVADLRAMLDIGDGAAVELVAVAHSELSMHLGERGYAALRAAVTDFDYESALKLLDQPRNQG